MNKFDELNLILNQGDETQIISAAQELGTVDDYRVFETLIHLLNTTENPRIRNATAIGLRDLGDSNAVPFLINHIKNPENTTNRGTLIYALETLEIHAFILDLVHIICDGNYEVSSMILRVIESSKNSIDSHIKDEAVNILRGCRMRSNQEKWRENIISLAIRTLKRSTIKH